MGAQRLPDIPAAEHGDGERADGDGDGAAVGAAAGGASASAAPTPAGPALPPATPVGAGAMTPPAAPAAAEAAAAAPAPVDDGGRPGARRSSRLGGALLLGGLALVAVAAILFLARRGGGDGSANDPTPAASTTATATQRQAQLEARATLVPPSNRPSLKAVGVVLVQRAQAQDQIVAVVQGLPKPKKGGYGIWLYSGPNKAQWLGRFGSPDQQGRLLARGELKAAIADYGEILVTREAKGNPARPGPIFLRGPVQLAGNSGGG
jgi:hypothetical protein